MGRAREEKRREEKKKETNLPNAFPYTFLQHTETTHKHPKQTQCPQYMSQWLSLFRSGYMAPLQGSAPCSQETNVSHPNQNNEMVKKTLNSAAPFHSAYAASFHPRKFRTKNFRQHGQMKSRDGKSQRREEKKKETNLPNAFPYTFLQHTETTHTNNQNKHNAHNICLNGSPCSGVDIWPLFRALLPVLRRLAQLCNPTAKEQFVIGNV